MESIKDAARNSNHQESAWTRLSESAARIERALVSTCLGAMVVLVLIQIVMRNLFNSGIVGSDSLVKHLVLWVGFLGAGLATRERTHIRIDIASRVLPLRLKSAAQILVDVFSVVIGVGLVYASCTFVSIEYESGGTIPFMQIPVWVMELIIPIGFLVITLRFFAQLVSTVSRLGKGSRPK